MSENQTMETPAVSAAPARLAMTGVDELVSRAFKFYRSNFKQFIWMLLVGFLATLPFYLFVFLMGLNGVRGAGDIIFGLLAFAAVIFMIYYTVRSQIGLYFILKDPKISFKENFKNTRTHFWKFFGLSLLVGVLVLLWSLLLIIPGIIFGVFYGFAIYILVFENIGGMAAIKKSQQLVTGYWWPVFGRTLFLVLGALLVSFVLSIPYIFFPEGGVLYYIYSFLHNVFWIVVAPIFLVFSYLMYKDLVRIKGTAK